MKMSVRLLSVELNHETFIQSSHGPSKSFSTSAVSVLFFSLLTRAQTSLKFIQSIESKKSNQIFFISAVLRRRVRRIAGPISAA